MFGQTTSRKDENFRIHVVRTIDDFIEKTFVTGVRDSVSVPIGEARRFINFYKLQSDHYIASDDKSIAEEYNLRLLETGLKID